ncbi:serine hydrolase domain-containing protein [Adhaeribacter aquaticus]|uniref:serine hydrolase domain-containing protein n=1 Tax=Adhaeribacter aquaticus TaxID=299567 RepID=UPI0006863174|nr:serine hydrolase domain-containing protein [Adhaeribacter aquaticus]
MKVFNSLLKFCWAASLAALFACSQSASESKQNTEIYNAEKARIQALYNPAKATKQRHQLDSLFRVLQKKRGFNGTVLITQFNKIIYKGAFGYADFTKKDTLTTQNSFQLASVSKQFTAMAIMMLQEEGKLNYEDSVQRFFPDFPYHGITIRHLLTHRSGLPNYTYFTDKHWPDRRVFITNEEVIQLLTRHKPQPYYKPNTKFDYSNTGYCLLAAIVTKAAEMPFENFMQERIFNPLGMKNTWVLSKNSESKFVPVGHTARRKKREVDYLDGVQGDKGIYSTVEDLYKWDQALYSEKLVKQSTLIEAFTGTNKATQKQDYGFGWRLKKLFNGEPIEYHGGLWHGFNNYLMRNRKDHSSIIVLSNVPNGSLMYLESVQQILYPSPDLISSKKDKPKSKS